MRSKIICVSSMKGGVGKTEVSLNLAMGIKKRTGKRVIVIDFDIPYGGVAQALALDKSTSITDWILTNRTISEKGMESIIVHHDSGLDIIPAIASSFDLERFTGDVAKRILHQLADFYDYIIIDSGVDLSEITKTALLEAHHIIIVTSSQTVSVWNNHQYKEDLLMLGIHPQKMLLFINQADKKKLGDLQKIIEAYETHGTPVNTVSIAYYDDAVRDTRNKRSFIYLKKKHTFTKAIDDLMQKLGVLTPQYESGGRGLFRFFRKGATR